jgi:hypothetical protein
MRRRQGASEQEALQKGMEAKLKEFRGKRARKFTATLEPVIRFA